MMLLIDETERRKLDSTQRHAMDSGGINPAEITVDARSAVTVHSQNSQV